MGGEGAERIAPIILKLSTISGRVVSFSQGCCNPRGRSAWYTLNRQLSGPHKLSGCFGEELNILILPGVDPTCPAYRLVTIDTELFKLLVLLQYLMQYSLAVNVLNSCWTLNIFLSDCTKIYSGSCSVILSIQTHTHMF